MFFTLYFSITPSSTGAPLWSIFTYFASEILMKISVGVLVSFASIFNLTGRYSRTTATTSGFCSLKKLMAEAIASSSVPF